MKKLLILFLLMLPLYGQAQMRFVIHMPFRGDPLFCCETGCIRKAQLAKRMKKAKHKREVQARKLKRNKDAKEIYVKTTPSPAAPQQEAESDQKMK